MHRYDFVSSHPTWEVIHDNRDDYCPKMEITFYAKVSRHVYLYILTWHSFPQDLNDFNFSSIQEPLIKRTVTVILPIVIVVFQNIINACANQAPHPPPGSLTPSPKNSHVILVSSST